MPRGHSRQPQNPQVFLTLQTPDQVDQHGVVSILGITSVPGLTGNRVIIYVGVHVQILLAHLFACNVGNIPLLTKRSGGSEKTLSSGNT